MNASFEWVIGVLVLWVRLLGVCKVEPKSEFVVVHCNAYVLRYGYVSLDDLAGENAMHKISINLTDWFNGNQMRIVMHNWVRDRVNLTACPFSRETCSNNRRTASQLRIQARVKGESQKVRPEVSGFVLILVGVCDVNEPVHCTSLYILKIKYVSNLAKHIEQMQTTNVGLQTV